ncbi:hypothetical protein FCV81_08845 [Vibrio breoganii]|nr:hypothetical protein FCV81_08845 [Vibrio breoganii]
MTWNQQERPKWRFEGRTEPLYRWVAGAKYIGLDDGIVVRHTCDNPYCFNPDHLVKGTTADNNHDRKGCTYK